ncbi:MULTISPECIES: hypothetical protein [unclassified Exiguobacterium]|uniref:hypothetical protein n=1 Tax=unclassified Exiguobacterium TaxID=2644629 RepID=UPI001BE91C5E|nr:MULTISPECIES: hypothetical protein [unclassified Exiguobacterium]
MRKKWKTLRQAQKSSDGQLNHIQERIKNKDGVFSIIAVMLILIIATIIAGYTDIIVKKWTINEVQAVMDLSGGNTLKKNVDLNQLYQEKIGGAGFRSDKSEDQVREELKQAVDERYLEKLEEAYRQELSNQVKVNDTIQSVKLENVRASFDYSTFGLGKNKSERPRPQFAIDALVRLEVNTSNHFDIGENYTSQVFNSFDNANFSVTVVDKANDGKQTLLVRSVTRLVYR